MAFANPSSVTECLKKARKNRGLERSLKMSIPPEVYDSLEKELEQIGME